MNYAQLLRLLTTMPKSKSLLIRGHLGIGKSALVKQAAMIMERQAGHPVALVDIRLSQQDVGDLRGIPYMVGGNTFFAPPMWYPIDTGYLEKQKSFLEQSGHKYTPWQQYEHGIIFLDELNRATREVLQCSFELTLDHRLGGVPIPPGWLVVAAVNHDARVYEVHKLDPAHINRFLVVDFSPTTKEWLRYAEVRTGTGEMHPSVLEYLQANPGRIDPLDADLEAASRDGSQVATRRSWTTLAEILNEMPAVDPHDEYTALLIQACIGSMHMANFLSYLQNRRKSIPPEAIVDRWNESIGMAISELIEDGQAHEVTAINRSVLDFLSRVHGMEAHQLRNMVSFLYALPDEMASDFYKSWKGVNNEQATTCYNLPDFDEDGKPARDVKGKIIYPLKKRMLKVFSNPDA